ncbi:tyrosine-type recombinase/integrase [Ferruginibacter sp.]
METVILKAIQHRNAECIGIYFTSKAILNGAVKNISGAKWSKTNRCWYMPLNKISHSKIVAAVKTIAIIEQTELHKYLTNKQKVTSIGNKSIPQPGIIKPAATLPQTVNKQITIHKSLNTYPVNANVIAAMHQHLILKAYSPSTIKTYINEMNQFLAAIKNTEANTFDTARIKKYLQYCHTSLKLSEATLHSRMNALKFYFEQVLKKEKFFWEIPRPKKQQQNPNFFNQDEITKIIKQTGNIKHKTMLMLAYSTGMRVSEVTLLKVWQIDSKRMQIKIQQAKGKKDRTIPLSPVLLVMLREYFITCKPDKASYLFCGQVPTEPYSTRSLQLVLQAAKQRAGILKPGSIHALRHSFATHLLDKGTDVSMIMKLLGHNDIKTTLRYLHVTNRDVLQIISPLDHLDLG